MGETGDCDEKAGDGCRKGTSREEIRGGNCARVNVGAVADVVWRYGLEAFSLRESMVTCEDVDELLLDMESVRSGCEPLPLTTTGGGRGRPLMAERSIVLIERL